MAAGTRVSRLLHELVPETTGPIRGHIVIESTRPLVAQQLFGDYRFSFLSAVPPAVVR